MRVTKKGRKNKWWNKECNQPKKEARIQLRKWKKEKGEQTSDLNTRLQYRYREKMQRNKGRRRQVKPNKIARESLEVGI